VTEILIMAMTHMRSGICTAGFIHDPQSPGRLHWVRPVKEHGTLLIGDMTTARGEVVRMGDVVDLALIEPRPAGNHVEDWVTDFRRRRPRILRHLTEERRTKLLADYCDPDPADVLLRRSRSLCLIRPDDLWASFALDGYSGKYEARLGFQLADLPFPEAESPRGLAVTDLKWRALGRRWLSDASQIHLSRADLCHRLAADEIYLSLGLSRLYQGRQWTLVIGVHPVPDYAVEIVYP
jgi:hypothetical protein